MSWWQSCVYVAVKDHDVAGFLAIHLIMKGRAYEYRPPSLNANCHTFVISSHTWDDLDPWIKRSGELELMKDA